MINLRLEKDLRRYTHQIREYKEEMHHYNSTFDGCSRLGRVKTIQEWFDVLEERAGTQEQYIAINENNKVVGMIQIRFNIEKNEILRTWGGHIGYSVRPTERQKGYGTEMLRLVLNECKNFGIDKVLVCCYKDNEASRKVILANKGVYECDTLSDQGLVTQRYWIDLS